MSILADPEVWECKDGRRIKVSEMKDSHLLNTIRMCIRGGKRYPLTYKNLLKEARQRGIWTDAEIIGWRLLGVSGKIWDLIRVGN